MPKYYDEVQVVKLIEAALSATMKSSWKTPKRPLCVRSLFTAIRLMTKPVQGKDYMDCSRRVATQYPEWVNKIVTWLLTGDAEQSISRLQESLTACSCDQSLLLIRELHIHPALTQVPTPTIFASCPQYLLFFLAILSGSLDQNRGFWCLRTVRGRIRKTQDTRGLLAL